jgi:hypothetical protein
MTPSGVPDAGRSDILPRTDGVPPGPPWPERSKAGQSDSVELAKVRNAARDMARAYIAFERAATRMTEASEKLGGATTDVVIAVQEGVRFPGGADAFNAIHARLAVGR